MFRGVRGCLPKIAVVHINAANPKPPFAPIRQCSPVFAHVRLYVGYTSLEGAMSSLQARYTELQATGRVPLYAYENAAPVDPLTSEVWERHTFARFKRFAAAHGPCHMPTLSRAFNVEQKRSRWSKQDAKTVEKARHMDDGELKRRSRSVASRAAQLRKKGSRQALVWDRLAGIYAAEEARRAPPDQLTIV
jgi:hypothetical protein